MNTLKLNADYTPLSVVSWQDALVMVLDGKADAVVNYDKVARSPSVQFPIPAVIRIKRYSKSVGRVGCSRRNVLARDKYTCQYCGATPSTDRLTIDHIVPRAMATKNKVLFQDSKIWGPVTSWENLVCACIPCNRRKGRMTLEQSRMTLLYGLPKVPDHAGKVKIMLNRQNVPAEWLDFIPK